MSSSSIDRKSRAASRAAIREASSEPAHTPFPISGYTVATSGSLSALSSLPTPNTTVKTSKSAYTITTFEAIDERGSYNQPRSSTRADLKANLSGSS